MVEALLHLGPVLEQPSQAAVPEQQTPVLVDGLTFDNPTLAEYYRDVHSEIAAHRGRPAEAVATEWLAQHMVHNEIVISDIPALSNDGDSGPAEVTTASVIPSEGAVLTDAIPNQRGEHEAATLTATTNTEASQGASRITEPDHSDLVGQEHVASPERLQKPRLKFVFWEHTPKNAKEAAAEVQDCAVLALETVGLRNQKERERFEQAATTFISSTATPRETRKAAKFLKRHQDQFGASAALFRELEGTDKRIVTFDIDFEDSEGWLLPQFGLLQDEFLAHARFLQSAGRNHPRPELRQRLAEWMAASAKSDTAREEVDIKQLYGLTHNKLGPDEKMGVLIGAVHTPVFHDLSRKIASERTFVGTAGAGQKALYIGADALMRKVRLHPDIPITDAELDRTVQYEISHMAPSPKRGKIHKIFGSRTRNKS